MAATLLELLTSAQAAVAGDQQAARSCLERATALLLADYVGGGTPDAAAGSEAMQGARNVNRRAQSALRGALPRWQVKRLVAYIEENLSRPIVCEELTALTGMSTGHFFRTFKVTFGEAPFAYIARRRIERAQELMRTTSAPLSRIALECGLCDQSHFTRRFRRMVGTTPRAWRREQALLASPSNVEASSGREASAAPRATGVQTKSSAISRATY